MALGYFALVLHAHLPFVRHPESKYVLEEEWLQEAITETYIPLLRVFEGLKRDEIDFKLTMSLTPPLVSMLRDEYLQDKYEKYLSKLQKLTFQEIQRHRNQGHLRYLAEYYEQEFASIREIWEKYQGDLIEGFKHFQQSNNLDLITCGATHGYFPLMQMYPSAVKAQVEIACDHFQENFDYRPKGIWLPECGYYQGLEEILAQAGLRYHVIDSHGLLYSRPRPCFGTYAPVFTPAGVAVFPRDQESSTQVWSSESGYPGDPVYREFYKDIGWVADYDYIKPYLMPNGQRKNVGIKYHRITNRGRDLAEKELYDPYWATKKAEIHAQDFLAHREQQVRKVSEIMEQKPIIVSPYDAELYGHWWYEGPQFIDFLCRQWWLNQKTVTMTHLADYLRENPTHQVTNPTQSSWGQNGFHEYWLNDTNGWIYPHLHKATERMMILAEKHPQDDLHLRALNQAARELLLAQSSDWAFIMRTGTMVSYAVRRTKSHLLRFQKLYQDIMDGQIDGGWLAKVEKVDNIFPHINYQVYRPQSNNSDYGLDSELCS